MSNTGNQIFQTLIEINALTGQPTGLTKPNIPGDPDYIPPSINTTACPITTWEPIDPYCIPT